jgi:tripartite-type tricarboxylate transporter receptor subunit TctC
LADASVSKLTFDLTTCLRHGRTCCGHPRLVSWQRTTSQIAATITAVTIAFLYLPAAQAQSMAEFYTGRSLELDISSSVGGGYDAYARMLARHIGRFIPGSPTVVAKNMEGTGGLRLANFLYNAAPKVGTTFATLYRGTVFDPLLGGKGAQFDATRFAYIGSANDEVSVCVAWHASGITKFEQVLTKELVVGASGPSADTFQFPKIVNGVLGTKFKIIAGYPGGNDIDLAMERGEVQGRCGWSWTSLKATRRSWLTDKKINILLQMGLSRHPDLPDVPLVIELARNDDDRAILKLIFARQVMAWPYVAPPDVPNGRAQALRAAFSETMKDRDFLADAEKSRLEIRPVSGEDVQKLVKDVYKTPPRNRPAGGRHPQLRPDCIE